MRSPGGRILRDGRRIRTTGSVVPGDQGGRSMSRIHAVLLGATSLVALASTPPVFAQQAAQSAASNSGQLEEIVVTARKTEEKLQVAPLSVTAITAAKLEAQNVQGIIALNGLAPNLNLSQGSGYGTACNVTIRGVNQADNVLTNDAPVA